MNDAQLEKAQKITSEINSIKVKVNAVDEQIDFIRTANKHRIYVEKVTLVEDQNPDHDSWGWTAPPMKEHTEVRNYSIDKEIMIGGLETIKGKLNKEIAELQKELDAV